MPPFCREPRAISTEVRRTRAKCRERGTARREGGGGASRNEMPDRSEPAPAPQYRGSAAPLDNDDNDHHAERPHVLPLCRRVRPDPRLLVSGSSDAGPDARPKLNPQSQINTTNNGARPEAAACRLRPMGRHKWAAEPAREG
jgi:hypothetical protein